MLVRRMILIFIYLRIAQVISSKDFMSNIMSNISLQETLFTPVYSRNSTKKATMVFHSRLILRAVDED